MAPDERPTPDRRLTVRVIHIAIAFMVFLTYAVLTFVQLSMDVPESGMPEDALRIAGYVLLIGLALAAWLVRQRIRAPGADEDVSDWWVRNQGRAIVAWALLESGGLASIVLGWIAGSTTLMGGGVIVALLLLFLTRPGSLERPT